MRCWVFPPSSRTQLRFAPACLFRLPARHIECGGWFLPSVHRFRLSGDIRGRQAEDALRLPVRVSNRTLRIISDFGCGGKPK